MRQYFKNATSLVVWFNFYVISLLYTQTRIFSILAVLSPSAVPPPVGWCKKVIYQLEQLQFSVSLLWIVLLVVKERKNIEQGRKIAFFK